MSVCVHISSSNEDTSHTGLDLTHVTSFYLHSFFPGPISKYTHIFEVLRLGLQHMNAEETQLSPCTKYLVLTG